MGSREPVRSSENASLQANVGAETVAEFMTKQCSFGQSRLYAEHDALVRREKHIWKSNRNTEKNRNPAAVCYNEGAVELTTCNKKEEKLDKDRTYINANILRSPYGNFILAQAPMADTLIDWYRMIWQMRISIIVCLIDPQNTSSCEPYFKPREHQTLKTKNRFIVKTISVREEDGGITNYQLRLTNKLSYEKNRTLYVIVMPTRLDKPVNPRRQLNLVQEVWATETANSSVGQDTEQPPVLVHGCFGVSRTAAFIATCMLCKSLQVTGEMSPVEVWARLNHARHNAAKERMYFFSSIECALLFAVDSGLISANNPNLIEANKMLRSYYEEDQKKERPPSASKE
ncbi:unnamed protein product [Cylicocyclus nassatus]|uniref:Tyrosine-protein phosphatase domain-containing protein n=1 Tax=Cylicocyclus nassatus TaxID=53992 RepID=A0AA36M370_CYLNA|nr:unnamed protein product [Cylicocyclus nassatus]